MQTSSHNIQVTRYSPDRAGEIAQLLNVSLAQKLVGQRDPAYWQWKHEANPIGRSILLLAEQDGRIVGVRAFMHWRLTSCGKTIEAAKPVDSVTHPDYQRRGIFSRLTVQACEVARDEGVQFLFNTPNAISKPGYLKLGWQEVAQLPLYVKLLHPLRGGWNAFRWKLRPGLIVEPAEFFRGEPPSAKSAFADAEALCHLLDECRRSNSRDSQSFVSPLMQTERTVDFLRWRYAQHPHIPYFAETVTAGGKLRGVLFYRTNFRAGLREIMIDDLIAATSDENFAAELIGQLRARVRADYVVAHAGKRTATYTALRKAGFHKVPWKRIALVARSLQSNGIPDPLQASNWSLCMGDIEGL